MASWLVVLLVLGAYVFGFYVRQITDNRADGARDALSYFYDTVEEDVFADEQRTIRDGPLLFNHSRTLKLVRRERPPFDWSTELKSDNESE